MRNGSTALAAAGLFALAGLASGEVIYGLTNLQQLVTFDSNTRAVTATTGLAGFSITGESLLSIDIRPATGQLYGLSNQGRLFIINPADGTSTAVAGGAVLSPAPAGGLRAIDFNPTVDRIRLITSNGTNLRVHPDTAVVTTDGSHAFAAGDVNAGDTAAVVNGAYTNSFAGAGTTQLFVLDATNDVLALQSPPNDGILNTRGPLGFNLATSGGFTGFDISGGTNTAYLVGNNLVGGGLAVNSLYTVDLTTGAATLAGPVTGTSGSFRDIAVVPAPGVAGLLGAGVLVARRRRR